MNDTAKRELKEAEIMLATIKLSGQVEEKPCAETHL
jgi:hypothetical protein